MVNQRLSRELVSWQPLEHPNVARFLGIVNCGPKKGLVSPFLPEKSSEFLARSQSWQPKLKMVYTMIIFIVSTHSTPLKVREIASGLEYLHGMNVVHGDLKPVCFHGCFL
jgi:serine/threonine protein kinase